MNEKIIEVKNLSKKFGSFTAVDSVSFSVEKGEIFGFLGPNGAGKTTTINMLCTLLKTSSGTAKLSGFDIDGQANDVRRCIGLIFQDPSLDDRLTGMQNLRFHARMYDVNKETLKERSDSLLEMVDLTDKIDNDVKTYSGGMKRRLEIARGLLHHPRILFLDEPTIGLDPQTRRHIWSYLRKLRESEGVTMFMTTHYMDEAENCDRVAIIDHGKIVALDSPTNLKNSLGGDIVCIDSSDNDRAEKTIKEEFDLESRRGPQNEVIIETAKGDRIIPKIIQSLGSLEKPISVGSVNLRQPTLEDVFVKLTGHAIREEEGDPGKTHLRQRMRMRG